MPYVEKCIANIEHNTSVPQSLNLIRKILDTYSSNPLMPSDPSKFSTIQVGW